MEIGEQRKDGKFTAEDGTEPKGGPEICDLYNRCLKWSDLVLERYAHTAWTSALAIANRFAQKRTSRRAMAADIRRARRHPE